MCAGAPGSSTPFARWRANWVSTSWTSTRSRKQPAATGSRSRPSWCRGRERRAGANAAASKRLSRNPAMRPASAEPSGARTQGGSNSSAIAPTEDAASAQVRRRQACAGGFGTASRTTAGRETLPALPDGVPDGVSPAFARPPVQRSPIGRRWSRWWKSRRLPLHHAGSPGALHGHSQDPAPGRQGIPRVYHTFDRGRFSVHVATSRNLVGWRHRATLSNNASQPTIQHAVPTGAISSHMRRTPAAEAATTVSRSNATTPPGSCSAGSSGAASGASSAHFPSARKARRTSTGSPRARSRSGSITSRTVVSIARPAAHTTWRPATGGLVRCRVPIACCWRRRGPGRQHRRP